METNSFRVVPLGTHISNAFYNGRYDLADFDQVVRDLKRAYESEKKGDDILGQNVWDEELAKCDRALAIYKKHMTAANEAAISELRQQGLEEFAEGLETGDYSHFAY